MPFLNTWADRALFTYDGSVRHGTRIHYGPGSVSTGVAHVVEIVWLQYLGLLHHFAGQTVPVGTSRTSPPIGSLGWWLNQVVTETAIASYVAPILIHERFADRVNDHELSVRPATQWPP